MSKTTLDKRIADLLSYSGLNAQRFASVIGCKTKQSIYDLLNGKTRTITSGMQAKISTAFPEVNEYWLLTGEGPMLKQVTQTQVVHGEHIHGNTITQTSGECAELAVLKEQVKHLESMLAEKELLLSEKERVIKLYERMMEGK